MKKAYVLIFFVGFLSFSCGQQSVSVPEKKENDQTDIAVNKVSHVSSEEFKSIMEKEKDNVIVLDVRTAMEVKEGKIPGAMVIDFYGDNFQEQVKTLDKGKKIMVYCRSGGRSAEAAQILSGLGYEVINLENGFMEWQKKGFPVEK